MHHLSCFLLVSLCFKLCAAQKLCTVAECRKWLWATEAFPHPFSGTQGKPGNARTRKCQWCLDIYAGKPPKESVYWEERISGVRWCRIKWLPLQPGEWMGPKESELAQLEEEVEEVCEEEVEEVSGGGEEGDGGLYSDESGQGVEQEEEEGEGGEEERGGEGEGEEERRGEGEGEGDTERSEEIVENHYGHFG